MKQKGIEEVYQKLFELNYDIKSLLSDVGYNLYGEVDVEYDANNPNETQKFTELRSMVDVLADVSRTLDYLKRPITGEYILHKGQNGRYACERFEFTCGCGIEVFIDDGYYDGGQWMLTSVEAKDGEYYLVARPNLPMEGLRVRFRER